MAKIVPKRVTVVSIEYDLNIVGVGERIVLYRDVNNSYDKKAIVAVRESNGMNLGFVSGNKHTVLSGCVSNRVLHPFIPSDAIPVVGKVVQKSMVNFRNGDLVTGLIVEVQVIEPDDVVPNAG